MRSESACCAAGDPAICFLQDHKALRDKYVAVTEQLQLVSRDASSTKAAADRSQESAKQALQVMISHIPGQSALHAWCTTGGQHSGLESVVYIQYRN